MNKYSLLFLFLIFLSSCSKDNNSSEEGSILQRLSSRFDGQMNAGNGNISNNLKGDFTVATTGAFLFDVQIGSITGVAEIEGSTYSLKNLSGEGIFKNSIFTDGTLDLDSETLQFSGTYIDTTPIDVLGDYEIVDLGADLQMERDALDKSSVWFTHNEPCNATITINSEVIENLGSHYQTGGLCSSTYGGIQGEYGSSSFRPVDGLSSQVLCETFTVWDPLESIYVVTTSCNTAHFVVDKNTEYSYTVFWENGETETGNFTSADGGAGVCLFISNPSADCSAGGGNFQEIIENTLFIDYSNSDTNETGQFEFPGPDFCGVFRLATNGSVYSINIGNFSPPGSNIVASLLDLPLEVGVYQIEATGSGVFGIFAIINNTDGNIYSAGFGDGSGTVEIVSIEEYSNGNGGEIHVIYDNVTLYASFLGSSPRHYINFSGTIKARWAD